MITEIAEGAGTARNNLSPEDMAVVGSNVCAISRSFCRVEFAREQLKVKSADSTLNEADVYPVIDAMVSLLQRDVAVALSPASAPAGVAPGQPATAAPPPVTAPVFFSEKCVAIISSLGRMAQCSEKCKSRAKEKGVLPVLLDLFKVPEDHKLHQVADTLLHLCILAPGSEGERVNVDPRILAIVREEEIPVESSDGAAGSSPTVVEKAPFVALDCVLSLLEANSSAEEKLVLFRLVRWLAALVESPENALALGESGMDMFLKIVIETSQDHRLLIGFLSKCVKAVAGQNGAACEVRVCVLHHVYAKDLSHEALPFATNSFAEQKTVTQPRHSSRFSRPLRHDRTLPQTKLCVTTSLLGTRQRCANWRGLTKKKRIFSIRWV